MTDEIKKSQDIGNESPKAKETTERRHDAHLDFHATELSPRPVEEVLAGNEKEEQVPVEPVGEEAAVVEPVQPEETEVAPEVKVEAPREPKEGGSQLDYSQTFRTLEAGDVVDGVVVHIDKEGVLVDVGTKSEGIIRPGELASGPIQAAEDVVSVGDKIEVYVLQPEGEDGNLMLSKKRADFENAWNHLQKAYEEGTVLTAMVSDRVRGGLVVDLGIRGFVPGSHVGSGNVKNLDRYVGQSLPLKVIEIDRERRKIVLSHRLAVEEDREKKRGQTLSSLAEGQIREGIVRRITDYGVFIDLGGIDGLLHISEMSWTRVKHPSDVVKVSQKIQVMVLKLNLEAGRVSLGLRQILPDPWAEVAGRYREGDIVRGTVSRLVPFGAFVQLDGGIEGIIPNAELSRRRVGKPEDIVSVGETVEAKVIDLRPEERRMTLSIRHIHEEKDREEYESHQASRSDGRMTLGDLIGDQLQQYAASAAVKEAEEVVEEAQDAAIETVAEVAQPEAVNEVPAETATEVGAEPEAKATDEVSVAQPEKSKAKRPRKRAVKKQPEDIETTEV